MNDVSPTQIARISARLLNGGVDEKLLREIADLKGLPPSMTGTMLTALSNTDDKRLRNILALTLAGEGNKDAIPRIVHLLKDPKTHGNRGTLLYALQKLHAIVDLSSLIAIILSDTPEAREEALVLLEETLEAGAKAADIEAALRSIAQDGRSSGDDVPEIVEATMELLREALGPR